MTLFAGYVLYDFYSGGWDFYLRKPEKLPEGSVKRLPGGVHPRKICEHTGARTRHRAVRQVAC